MDNDRDGSLQVLVGTVDVAPEPARVVVNLTVLVGGRHLTGRVVPEEQYFRWLAEDSTDTTGLASLALESQANEAGRRAERMRDIFARSKKGEPVAPPELPDFLHLQAPAEEGHNGLWRIAITSVDAWTLGGIGIEFDEMPPADS